MLNFLKKNTITAVKYTREKRDEKKSETSFLFGDKSTCDVYFGGQYTTRDIAKFRSLGITAVINMRSAIQPADLHTEFKYLHLPMPENFPPDLDSLIKGGSFIEQVIKEGGKVYINCLRGKGRGPVLVIAWLILCGETFGNAYEIVKSCRSDIELNYSQIDRLKELQANIKEAVNF
jgi:hypothetical protein